MSDLPSMTPQQAHLTRGGFAAYREFAVGSSSLPFLFWYELVTLGLSNLPGLLGIGARSMLYPSLFNTTGKRPAIGRGVVLRNPRAIALRDRVVVDDYAVLDARGSGARIEIGSHVAVGRFTTVAAKGGSILLDDGVNIGSYCRVATQSQVVIGKSTLIAAFCYIGPGNHSRGDDSKPLIERSMEIRGGVTIGEHAWIGAHSTILDGVTIGAGAVVGAHSLVLHDVPQGAVVAGTPARPLARG